MNRFPTLVTSTTAAVFMLGSATLSANAHEAVSAGHQSWDRGPDQFQSDTSMTVSTTPLLQLASFKAMDPASEDQAVRSFNGHAFNVIAVGALQRGDAASYLQNRKQTEPQIVASLQKSIRANAALDSALQSRGVEIDNIFGALPAADGSMTFYVQ